MALPSLSGSDPDKNAPLQLFASAPRRRLGMVGSLRSTPSAILIAPTNAPDFQTAWALNLAASSSDPREHPLIPAAPRTLGPRMVASAWRASRGGRREPPADGATCCAANGLRAPTGVVSWRTQSRGARSTADVASGLKLNTFLAEETGSTLPRRNCKNSSLL